METNGPEPETLRALLLELARARRARQFYPPGHPSLVTALERAHQTWSEGLASGHELEFQQRSGVLLLADGQPAETPGTDELARELRLRNVRRLRFHPDLTAEEFGTLIELLAAPAADPESRPTLESDLIRCGVRHITTGEIDFAEHFERVEAGADDSVLDEELAPAAPPDPAPIADPAEDEDRAVRVEALDELLDELELASDADGYRRVADRVAECVHELVAEKSAAQARPALQRYCADSLEAGRQDAAIRVEARDRLGRLLQEPELLDTVLESARSGGPADAVEAVQILLCAGSQLAGAILERYERAELDTQPTLATVLIAMGEDAFPALATPLASSDPTTARRSARLLGWMQNPRSIGLLRDRLEDADAELRQEVARALLRVGTEEAARTLQAAAKRYADLVEVVAAGLGDVRGDVAVQTLAEFVRPESGFSDAERREAIRSLGRSRNPQALPALKAVLGHRSFLRRKRNRALRVAAVQAIARLGGAASSEILSSYAGTGDRTVRRVCREALARAVVADSP